MKCKIFKDTEYTSEQVYDVSVKKTFFIETPFEACEDKLTNFINNNNIEVVTIILKDPKTLLLVYKEVV